MSWGVIRVHTTATYLIDILIEDNDIICVFFFIVRTDKMELMCCFLLPDMDASLVVEGGGLKERVKGK